MGASAPPAVVEVFDPESGTSLVASPAPRELGRHRAVALASGHVLFFGGDEASLGKPLLGYYADGDEWIEAGELVPPRFVESATELVDGRVLVVGVDARGRSRVDLWDPPAMRALPTGQMAAARPGHAAIGLRDGRVLVSGGWVHEGGRVAGVRATTEVWDPTTTRWSPAAAMRAGRHHHAATLLLDGRVLVSGGAERGEPELEVWAADSSTALAPHGVASRGHTATRLADGRVLLVGGATSERFGPVHAVEDGLRVRPLERLGSARAGHTSTLLHDGRLLVLGGADEAGAPLASAEAFDPPAGAWSPLGTLSAPRARHTATLLDDGRILVAGGLEQTA